MARGRSKGKPAYKGAITLSGSRSGTTRRATPSQKGYVGNSRFPKKPPRGNGRPSPTPTGSKPDRRVMNTKVATGNTAP